ncbi:TAXI family TRAP transporter solute-binding subunit [Anderseniella sp. Alg231-50]|uniref:TAXI family TRAP transporter solute-binding subunit n=1 Tax=Anderseniella sp. Alg231-50 TaxID=1922226 RepID=UPI000D55301F
MLYLKGSLSPKLKPFALLLAGLWLIMLAPVLSSAPANAQNQSEAAIRERANAGKVTLITGGVDGVSNTYQQLAGDLASVLDVKSELRVLPVIGYGSLQNIEDLLFLKGIDVGMVHSDVMRHMEQRGILPGARNRLKYVTKLYDEQLHILANTKYTDVKQLNGQTIIVGRPGTGNEMSALTLLRDLRLKPKLIHVEFKEGVQRVRDGRAAAMVVVTRKPSSKLRKIKAGSGLHFLPVPMTKTVLRAYFPDPLTAEDYPNLVQPGKPVQTARMAAILAVYNWGDKTARYANVTRFIRTFIDKFDQLSTASRKDVWQKLDFTGEVKGWQQYGPAAKIIRKAVASRQVIPTGLKPKIKKNSEFAAFVKLVQTTTNKEYSPNELLKLYLSYKDWSEKQ